MREKIEKANVVIVDWSDLIETEKFSSENIQNILESAYGRSGCGILGIRNVPGFVEAKESFLPLAHQIAVLPQEYLDEHLTDAQSLYNAGWSHGKEQLGAGKPPDLAKGSFYFNPVTDLPGTEQDRQQFPLSYPQNKWPESHVIPGFREKAVRIGLILRDACVQVARHIDALALAKQSSYLPNQLYENVKGTDKVKARLLYYFPLPIKQDTNENDSTTEDSWIGWHNDSGFLTALAGGIYVNHKTGKIIDCPEEEAGLYVVDRVHPNRILKVEVPYDCLAVQIGECTEILTGGAVQATPHCVRGCRFTQDIGRIALPCFVDTPPCFVLKMPPNCTREQVLAATCTDKVPRLEHRWYPGITFGDFLQQTFLMYYATDSKNGRPRTP